MAINYFSGLGAQRGPSQAGLSYINTIKKAGEDIKNANMGWLAAQGEVAKRRSTAMSLVKDANFTEDLGAVSGFAADANEIRDKIDGVGPDAYDFSRIDDVNRFAKDIEEFNRSMSEFEPIYDQVVSDLKSLEEQRSLFIAVGEDPSQAVSQSLEGVGDVYNKKIHGDQYTQTMRDAAFLRDSRLVKENGKYVIKDENGNVVRSYDTKQQWLEELVNLSKADLQPVPVKTGRDLVIKEKWGALYDTESNAESAFLNYVLNNPEKTKRRFLEKNQALGSTYTPVESSEGMALMARNPQASQGFESITRDQYEYFQEMMQEWRDERDLSTQNNVGSYVNRKSEFFTPAVQYRLEEKEPLVMTDTDVPPYDMYIDKNAGAEAAIMLKKPYSHSELPSLGEDDILRGLNVDANGNILVYKDVIVNKTDEYGEVSEVVEKEVSLLSEGQLFENLRNILVSEGVFTGLQEESIARKEAKEKALNDEKIRRAYANSDIEPPEEYKPKAIEFQQPKIESIKEEFSFASPDQNVIVSPTTGKRGMQVASANKDLVDRLAQEGYSAEDIDRGLQYMRDNDITVKVSPFRSFVQNIFGRGDDMSRAVDAFKESLSKANEKEQEKKAAEQKATEQQAPEEESSESQFGPDLDEFQRTAKNSLDVMNSLSDENKKKAQEALDKITESGKKGYLRSTINLDGTHRVVDVVDASGQIIKDGILLIPVEE